MPSPLADILREELQARRTFLSTDEVAALSRAATVEDEEDLALVRVRRRRSVFNSVLRSRFIRDGKPVAVWRGYIEEEEADSDAPTVISQHGRRVLEWAVRTADREAMASGFASRLLRWIGIVALLWGLYSCATSDTAPGLMSLAVAAICLVAAQVLGNLASDRIAGRLRAVFDAPDRIV